MSQEDDGNIIRFPLNRLNLPADKEHGQRAIISSQTLSLLTSLHSQLGAYFSAQAEIKSNEKSMTAGEIVNEIVSATQILGTMLPTWHHTNETKGGADGYDEEQYSLSSGDPMALGYNPNAFAIFAYKDQSGRFIYQLMIIDVTPDAATKGKVSKRYVLSRDDIVSEEDIKHPEARTALKRELEIFEGGSDQHITSILFDSEG